MRGNMTREIGGSSTMLNGREKSPGYLILRSNASKATSVWAEREGRERTEFLLRRYGMDVCRIKYVAYHTWASDGGSHPLYFKLWYLNLPLQQDMACNRVPTVEIEETSTSEIVNCS